MGLTKERASRIPLFSAEPFGFSIVDNVLRTVLFAADDASSSQDVSKPALQISVAYDLLRCRYVYLAVGWQLWKVAEVVEILCKCCRCPQGMVWTNGRGFASCGFVSADDPSMQTFGWRLGLES